MIFTGSHKNKFSFCEEKNNQISTSNESKQKCVKTLRGRSLIITEI